MIDVPYPLVMARLYTIGHGNTLRPVANPEFGEVSFGQLAQPPSRHRGRLHSLSEFHPFVMLHKHEMAVKRLFGQLNGTMDKVN